MVYTKVSEAYIHFALMYTAAHKFLHIFLVPPIKYLINEDGKLITPFKLATGTKTSISNLCVSFCPCVVQKYTVHVETEALNISHQEQNGFCGIFVGITQNQKGHLVYVPHKHRIISSYDVVFDESFSTDLAYASQLYSESMAIRPAV